MKIRILEVLVVCFALALKATAQTPAILSQPQSATHNVASAADFTVVATNAATYQWYFQGTNNLPGATNATLSLDELSSNQAGSYTVVVSSANNISVTSAPPAVLTIVPGTIVQFTLSTYPGGGGSNFLVQLFDYDKPATVENFIHYIAAGAYANMFFDRDATSFVLQGGGYVTADRSDTNLAIEKISPGTNFPSQVDSEFNVGPLIHNEFGTLAMALATGEPNSASSAFYFNLVDNSANLDFQNGGFTVFGRILTGSNVLQYFNTLSAPSNGIFDYATSNLSISTLPVNYDGTNQPTDANLFYCDFAFQTPPPVDTTPPTVSITFPAPNLVFTNASALTVQGTAQDNVGLAEVFCVLTSITNGSAGVSQTNAAQGTTNWSLNLGYLAPGLYQLTAYAQDGAGNLSAPATENFTSMIPPIILTQPTNLTILGGSTADFSVTTANATSYQWQLVGTGPISGATNATLALADVSTNQSGSSYEVVVTGPDGQTVSSTPVTLTVVAGTLVQITFSGFPDGSSSNVVVQLFDREKPATVANFLHYITPVQYFGYLPQLAFSNMIWDRCVPGFVLQGGDYQAADRTTGNPLQQLESIYSSFTQSLFYTPGFAEQVDNEFDVGPLIHNTFGTLAMAKQSGDPDSAANAFFFNLADNSTNLDTQNGGYTVFGRVISGSNVLQYFNTLSKPNQGIFDSTTASTDQSLPNLPVNYHGWGAPVDSNLFFADFTQLSTFNADTNPPAVVVNSPTNGQVMTSADVVLQGAASDDVGVANVACFCNGSNFSSSVYAIGTTNWTADLGVLPPGQYTNTVRAQDGAGNYSKQASNIFVVPRIPFEVSVTGNGTVPTTLNGTNATLGEIYTIKATPGKGAVFLNWVSGTNVSLSPTLNFIMANGLQITANFISNNVRGGISITSLANSELTNTTFSIAGKLAAGFSPTQLTCQFFSAITSNSVSTNMVLQATKTNTWSTPALSLAPGYYFVQAVAQAAGGRAAVVTQEFAILAPLTVIILGHGKASIPNGTYLRVGVQYTEGVESTPGQSFVSWNAGNGAFTVPAFPFIMNTGTTFTLTMISNSLAGKFTMTSPAANAQVTNPMVAFGGKIPQTAIAPQVVCQIFQNDTPLTGFRPAVITGTNWTLPATNLTMGIYNAVAMATDASGKTTLASEQFTINFYPNIAGSYKGLFFDPAAISQTSAGYVSFQLSSSQPLDTGAYGVVSGNLTFPLKNYPFSFQMSPSGAFTIQPVGLGGSLSMAFDVTNFSGETSGFVTRGAETSPLTAYRTLTKLSTNTVPSPGNYVLDLEPVTPTNGILNGPPGDSFVALAVSSSGNLAVAGTMADDSSFSQSSGVFTNGVWPLYGSFYKGQGLLLGWETNLPTGECNGALYWIKSRTNGVYYTNNGLDEELISVGTNVLRPTTGLQYMIVFGGGTVIPSVTNQFSFNSGGTMVPAAGTMDQLKGSLVLSTGVLKGSIVNPANKKTLDFSGVFFGPSQGGTGFTLDVGAQTGYFDITPIVIVP